MRVRHALSGAIYKKRDDGLVEVELDGKSGVFQTDGRWVRGELRSADPHLLIWIRGQRDVSGRRLGGAAVGDHDIVQFQFATVGDGQGGDAGGRTLVL